MARSAHTLAELTAIRDALTTLGNMVLPIGYLIAKNLRIVRTIVDEAHAIGREFTERLIEGRTPRLVVISEATKEVLRPYADGDVVASGERVAYNLTDDDRRRLAAFEQEMNSTDHDVEWHGIAESLVEALTLPGNAVECLLGNIITGSERRKE
ncbi:MAG: hypothetical protein J0I17_11230 ['Candidatus Kapabacteria' thiocyanatum]|uniref:Uncharacterized protein n=1 Tax=Candidatus Kapaibacterium thiocyanatum TaxID=1895771 RepID=A0A1M3KYU7_9BACT|nr:hypothetical protein ['Candidatus Kapabacteria' thiocyanatum]OJX57677.1 MAG: hypothetical protein BGO89_06815 ['Candidatus Kapabacteria' thiocyanatum]